MAKIFISYKRNVEPDTPVAMRVFESLNRAHEVFIDQTLQIGEKWAERIQREIKASDYLIVFLSKNSTHSEMVVAEIETAHHNNKDYGKPVILPIRLNFTEALPYPLSAYLNPLQWAIWEGEEDTSRLIMLIEQAISGGELPKSEQGERKFDMAQEDHVPTAYANMPIRQLESPEGTMPHESPLYVEREGDHIALSALERTGVTITIKAPRQMGKSSLLNRVIEAAEDKGYLSAFIDFQLFEKATFDTADIFYRQFVSLISWELEMEDRSEEFWQLPLGNVQRTTRYLQNYLLDRANSVSILLAMDEVERIFASPFRSDFFSMLRSWHNNRSRSPNWKFLNLALVTSTEPYQFIADLNQSPFNVGEVIELDDFTFEQVIDLNQRHGSPLNSSEVKQLYALLSGHPYLTRKAFYLLSRNQITFREMLDTACEDNGPFGDHLRNHLYRMQNQQEVKDGLLQVLKQCCCSDENIFFRLRGAGFVYRRGDVVLPRNKLYADYFGKRLNA